MQVLVVNIGSTSFKFRLFDMRAEQVLARGGVEGVGTEDALVFWRIGDGQDHEERRAIADQAESVRICTKAVLGGTHAGEPLAIDAVGFKAVHGGHLAEAEVTDELLEVMAEYADIVPAHNPPYMAAMRAFGEQMPDVPRVAGFETGFHRTVSPARRTFAIPYAWKTEYGIERYGFHGA
jgi:acetate kinase